MLWWTIRELHPSLARYTSTFNELSIYTSNTFKAFILASNNLIFISSEISKESKSISLIIFGREYGA